MKKLSIKNIVKFKGKLDRYKKNFVASIMKEKAKVETDDGGGDYWVTSLSAISNSFKLNDLKPIIDKRDELEGKFEASGIENTKAMYKKNIDVLYNYEKFDLKTWMPQADIKFVKKYKSDFILNIKGLQVEAVPKYVFSFEKEGVKNIGAIWFIGRLNGFKKDELGMFTDILYRYLKTHYSKDYLLNSKYCIAVDVFNKFEVNYSQLETEEIPLILDSTLDEIKKLL